MFVDLSVSSRMECRDVAFLLSRYARARSIALLAAWRIPIPHTLIVTAWTPNSQHKLNAAVQAHGWKSALLRSDVPLGRGTKPQGGFLVERNCIEAAIREILEDGRIAILTTPYSRVR